MVSPNSVGIFFSFLSFYFLYFNSLSNINHFSSFQVDLVLQKLEWFLDYEIGFTLNSSS